MLKFKRIEWSHAFSYGANNSIVLDLPLVQLLGRNGHGKSSIANVLEEVLYNKNSKSIKKGSVLNRYSKAKSYEISLYFEKDGDSYEIHTTRGTTQKVVLLKNDDDISAHTSTGTYKLIEAIIGYDHKTFTQIVYQSNAFSLEFLTATDTNRKKFLIDLLRLDRYTEIAEKIKEDLKTKSQEVELLNMKITSITSWLSKIKAEDLITKERVLVPEPATAEKLELASIEESLRTLVQTNKRIQQNNTYKQLLANIDCGEIRSAPTYDLLTARVTYATIGKQIAELKPQADVKISNTCITCGQTINNEHKLQICTEAKNRLSIFEAERKVLAADIAAAEIEEKAFQDSRNRIQEFEKYAALIDKSIPSTPIDGEELAEKAKQLSKLISDNSSLILSASKANQAIDSHNAKAEVLNTQLNEMMRDKEELSTKLALVSEVHSSLQILAKAFSPSGFIAYKIESSVKDLEELTNTYLADMSDGRFQLGFKISSSDKLDVVITDNGIDIEITALSNGELARVNISTLLAIRKLIESLSDTRTNLLILDETVESLDAEGKEKLIEILLAEEHLNTILVSHGFTHPLLTKVEIVKENNISRIE